MNRAAARSLQWLAALLALYLCAPFIASVQQLGRADWANVDWTTMGSAVGVSVASASVASLVILVTGVPLGYLLARSSSRKMALLGFIVQLPLALPPLTSGVLLLFLFGPYSWIGRLTGGLLTDSFVGIVLAETFVAAPFLIIAAKSAIAAVDPVFDDVAATLGHRAASRFFRITLPIAWPAIRAGLALAWLRAFGEFGATVMVAYHPYSLPVYTYVVFGGQGLPAMMPLLLPTLLIAIVCAALSLYSRGAKARAPHCEDECATIPLNTTPAKATQNLKLSLHLVRDLGTFKLDIAWQPNTRRLAIIGPSGSGKSLALRLIAGLESTANSQITLGATDLGSLAPEQRQIGYMPQDYGLFPHLTVAQQLTFARNTNAGSARYWIEHLGLSRLITRLPAELSFGQRQRVALARALSRHSQLLLFDEPFAALDTPRRRRLQQSLRQLQSEIAAVSILVTHDPDEAALLADEVLVIEQGRVLQAGTISEVYQHPTSLRVAELLGLYNIGTGTVCAQGWLATDSGLQLPLEDHTLSIGQPLMWRIAAHALCRGATGSYPAKVIACDLRSGERYVQLDMGGIRCHIASEDLDLQPGTLHHFNLAANGVSAWPVAGNSGSAPHNERALRHPVNTERASPISAG